MALQEKSIYKGSWSKEIDLADFNEGLNKGNLSNATIKEDVVEVKYHVQMNLVTEDEDGNSITVGSENDYIFKIPFHILSLDTNTALTKLNKMAGRTGNAALSIPNSPKTVLAFEATTWTYPTASDMALNIGSTATDIYTLDGFYSDSNLTRMVNQYTRAVEDIKVYANWKNTKAPYTIKYSNTEIPDNQRAQLDTVVLAGISNPVKKGYTFTGWNATIENGTYTTVASTDTYATVAGKLSKEKDLENVKELFVSPAFEEKSSYTVNFDQKEGTGGVFSSRAAGNVRWTDKVLDLIETSPINPNNDLAWYCGDILVDENTTYEELAKEDTVTSINLQAVYTANLVPTPTPTTAPEPSPSPASTPSVESQKEAGTLLLDRESAQINLTQKVKATKSTNRLSWKKVKDADGYLIYASYCSTKKRKHNLKRIKTISSAAATSFTHRGLKKNTWYLYKVKAYKTVNGKEVILGESLELHSKTAGNKQYTNPVKVKVKNKRYSLSVGQKKKIKTQVLLPKGKKTNWHIAKVRYITSNSSVAKIGKTGTLQGKRKGTCYIYAVAQNGAKVKIKGVIEN